MLLYIIYTLIFDVKNVYRLRRLQVVIDPFKYEIVMVINLPLL